MDGSAKQRRVIAQIVSQSGRRNDGLANCVTDLVYAQDDIARRV